MNARAGSSPVGSDLLAILGDAERLLVAETEPAALAALDEDGVIALHTRVRRARSKYVSQYRRAAARRVPVAGGRGRARPLNSRARQKAEVFELVLSQVSARLAELAAEAADELRSARLAMARSSTGHGGPDSLRGTRVPSARTVTTTPTGDRALRSPASERRRATTQARDARRQAGRDAR
jgi:hypothetical protein